MVIMMMVKMEMKFTFDNEGYNDPSSDNDDNKDYNDPSSSDPRS